MRPLTNAFYDIPWQSEHMFTPSYNYHYHHDLSHRFCPGTTYPQPHVQQSHQSHRVYQRHTPFQNHVPLVCPPKVNPPPMFRRTNVDFERRKKLEAAEFNTTHSCCNNWTWSILFPADQSKHPVVQKTSGRK